METIDKKKLKADAHGLKPVVLIGHAGLTDAVLAEIEAALAYHELIKVKIRAEREERKQMTEMMVQRTGSALIQTIGQMTVLYKRNPNK